MPHRLAGQPTELQLYSPARVCPRDIFPCIFLMSPSGTMVSVKISPPAIQPILIIFARADRASSRSRRGALTRQPTDFTGRLRRMAAR